MPKSARGSDAVVAAPACNRWLQINPVSPPGGAGQLTNRPVTRAYAAQWQRG